MTSRVTDRFTRPPRVGESPSTSSKQWCADATTERRVVFHRPTPLTLGGPKHTIRVHSRGSIVEHNDGVSNDEVPIGQDVCSQAASMDERLQQRLPHQCGQVGARFT